MWNGGHENDETTRRLSIELAIAQHTGSSGNSYERERANDGYDYAEGHNGRQRSMSADSTDGDGMAVEAHAEPRGKPEAMAARLASAARLQEKKEELESEKEHEAVDVVARPVADDPLEDSKMDATAAVISEVTSPANSGSASKPKKKRKKAPTPKKTKAANHTIPTMDDPVKPITDVEYANLTSLMIHFCRVPLLAEFSRPVSLLHPELMNIYSKIVEHPIDLGTVSRKIRKRQYKCLRDVRLDAWIMFANCVRYHSHPTNKEAVPSFVSIALHLRDYFNDLWQEHMLPSDPPHQHGAKPAKSGLEIQMRAAYAKRKKDRKKRLVVSGLSVMTGKSLDRAADTLHQLVSSGGCVDGLDANPIFGEDANEDDEDLDAVVENLWRLHKRLKQIATTNEDYGIDELDRDVRRCYTEEVLENNSVLQMRIANRLDRWIGKIVVPIHEATCRGVSQSSIWGCMAAAVWARESSKKPFWPALVLGIMAPQDQREEWHDALTTRNESRLPEKLKSQLAGGKRKAEGAIKKQASGQLEPQSFFLVEFLGTHEFIWVREADIVENFDPQDDPNLHVGSSSKKKRASRSHIANVVGSKMYASATEEARWALEEFELQLQDVGGDLGEEEDDGEEMNYSYAVLCQSDDEADEEVCEQEGKGFDIEDCNELLATNGLFDFSLAGRKNAKKRAQAMKRQKLDKERKVKADKAKKLKAEQSKKRKDAKAKERESKKEQKDLEKKRRKRARERDRAMKSTENKHKKRRVSDSDDVRKSTSGRRNLIVGKRERAQAIVEGYLGRAYEKKDYKTLCLGGVMTIPASLIDSTGLLGMALAFRAAAGEIPMPDESGDKQTRKPWEAINVADKKTSSERCECLEKQIAMLEKEIEKVKANTATRISSMEKVRQGIGPREERTHREDKTARQNPMKKKKPLASAEKRIKKKAESPRSSKASHAPDDQVGVEIEGNEMDVQKTKEEHPPAAQSPEEVEAAIGVESSGDEEMVEAPEQKFEQQETTTAVGERLNSVGVER